MIHGTGTDILHIDRIRSLYLSNPEDVFFTSVFTEKERKLIQAKQVPLYSYATRFAGKEAVFKALRIHSDDIRLNEIEILENEKGAPTVTLYGNALNLAHQAEITRIHISLSYDTDYAIAFATCEKADRSR